MHFAILGAGAVGGYFGALLARAGHRVSFVARGAHLHAIRQRGLLVWSPLGDFVVRAEAHADPAAIGHADVVIVAVKTYDNPSALPLLRPMVGPSTSVLTLQNGVDSPTEVAEVVGEDAVLGGTTYIATARAAPGLIEQTGTYRRIVFGEVFRTDRGITERVTAIADALRGAGVDVRAVADARVPLWEKFVYLCPFAAVTGASRAPAGVVWRDERLRALLLDAAAEVEAVGRASGIPLGSDLRQRVIHYMETVPATMRSSLLIDLQAGKPIEVEALQGAAVRRAKAVGVPVPNLELLYALLRPQARGTRAPLPS